MQSSEAGLHPHPWLFNVFSDSCKGGKKRFCKWVRLPTGELGVLFIADDVVLMSDTAEGLESNLNVMSQMLSRWEQKMN